MKIKMLKLAAMIAASAAVLALTSCSSDEPRGEHSSITKTEPGVPGAVMIDTYQQTSTVTAIDKTTRKLTLVAKDGTTGTFTASPAVANFDQLEVGDQVKAVLTDQLVVFVRNPGEPSGDGAAALVALAPLGAKPGAVFAHTAEITAKVQSIDVKHQKATLLFPDGTKKTFEVRKDVDLTKQTVGSDVVFRTTEALVISVDKP
jgi:translation elongation factor P/translation initiation factor 5A